MAGNHLQALKGLAEYLRCPQRNKVMARSVSSVTAYPVGLVELPRKAVHVCVIRHGLVERGIKHDDVREFREGVPYCLNAHDVAGIVQGSKGDALSEAVHDLRVNEHRLFVEVAAADYAVSCSGNLIKRVKYSVIFVEQRIKHELHCYFMILDGGLNFEGVCASFAVGEVGAVDPDAVNKSFCRDRLVFHVEELILEGGTSAVDYENFHYEYLPSR